MTQKVSDTIVEDKVNTATLITDTTETLLRKFNEKVISDTLSRCDVEIYRIAADALLKYKNVEGIKSDADRAEQEARILNLRRQAEADKPKDTEIVFEFRDDTEDYSQ